jgi:hypothetical protein
MNMITTANRSTTRAILGAEGRKDTTHRSSTVREQETGVISSTSPVKPSKLITSADILKTKKPHLQRQSQDGAHSNVASEQQQWADFSDMSDRVQRRSNEAVRSDFADFLQIEAFDDAAWKPKLNNSPKFENTLSSSTSNWIDPSQKNISSVERCHPLDDNDSTLLSTTAVKSYVHHFNTNLNKMIGNTERSCNNPTGDDEITVSTAISKMSEQFRQKVSDFGGGGRRIFNERTNVSEKTYNDTIPNDLVRTLPSKNKFVSTPSPRETQQHPILPTASNNIDRSIDGHFVSPKQGQRPRIRMAPDSPNATELCSPKNGMRSQASTPLHVSIGSRTWTDGNMMVTPTTGQRPRITMSLMNSNEPSNSGRGSTLKSPNGVHRARLSISPERFNSGPSKKCDAKVFMGESDESALIGRRSSLKPTTARQILHCGSPYSTKMNGSKQIEKLPATSMTGSRSVSTPRQGRRSNLTMTPNTSILGSSKNDGESKRHQERRSSLEYSKPAPSRVELKNGKLREMSVVTSSKDSRSNCTQTNPKPQRRRHSLTYGTTTATTGATMNPTRLEDDASLHCFDVITDRVGQSIQSPSTATIEPTCPSPLQKRRKSKKVTKKDIV